MNIRTYLVIDPRVRGLRRGGGRGRGRAGRTPPGRPVRGERAGALGPRGRTWTRGVGLPGGCLLLPTRTPGWWSGALGCSQPALRPHRTFSQPREAARPVAAGESPSGLAQECQPWQALPAPSRASAVLRPGSAASLQGAAGSPRASPSIRTPVSGPLPGHPGPHPADVRRGPELASGAAPHLLGMQPSPHPVPRSAGPWPPRPPFSLPPEYTSPQPRTPPVPPLPGSSPCRTLATAVPASQSPGDTGRLHLHTYLGGHPRVCAEGARFSVTAPAAPGCSVDLLGGHGGLFPASTGSDSRQL